MDHKKQLYQVEFTHPLCFLTGECSKTEKLKDLPSHTHKVNREKIFKIRRVRISEVRNHFSIVNHKVKGVGQIYRP